MTSQINFRNFAKDIAEFRDCRSPENAPADYCQKLKNGIVRLQRAIQSHYEAAFPTEREWIARAGAKRKRRPGPHHFRRCSFLRWRICG